MKYLRNYIRREILKEAVKIDSRKLMLLKAEKSGYTCYVLATRPSEDYELDSSFEWDYSLGCVMLVSDTVGPCAGAKEVEYGAARSGWGPTLYDLVMELEPNGIINARDDVSEDMTKMMKRYKDTRSDVDKELLDNMDDPETYPRTPEPEDDCYPGDAQSYKGGIIDPEWSEVIQRWEDDPLSYAYNKDMSMAASFIKSHGDDFIEKHGLDFSQLKRWQEDLFNELFI